ncbi:MAG: hypothetical protein LBV75_08025, partial [Paludibacter sp.]|nr:hypothetical protein [Paludibacter sp.]
WIDGYYDLAFTPQSAAGVRAKAKQSSKSTVTAKAAKIIKRTAQKAKCTTNNFKIQTKINSKILRNNFQPLQNF